MEITDELTEIILQWLPPNLWYKAHQIPNLNVSFLVLQLSLPNSLMPDVAYVVGAAPTGDAPTTSEWSTLILPTYIRGLKYLNGHVWTVMCGPWLLIHVLNSASVRVPCSCSFLKPCSLFYLTFIRQTKRYGNMDMWHISDCLLLFHLHLNTGCNSYLREQSVGHRASISSLSCNIICAFVTFQHYSGLQFTNSNIIGKRLIQGTTCKYKFCCNIGEAEQ